MPTLNDEIEKAEKNGQLETSNQGDIEKALDLCLRVALTEKRTGGNEYTNVLFIGSGGSGKTSRIKAWAEAHNVHLKEVHTADLDQTDMGGAVAPDKTGKYVTRLSPTEMDSLDQPRSVLFLDEYNRGIDQIRGTLLTLIENHTVYDVEAPNLRRELKGLLFTIAAINPFSAEYNTNLLDLAEESRFMTVFVNSDPKATLSYLKKKFTSRDEPGDAGRLAIATALLTNDKFKFSNPEDEAKALSSGNRKPLSARTLTRLLNTCDGTKEDFLGLYGKFCDDGLFDMVKSILSTYKDVKDKANQVLEEEGEISGEENKQPIFSQAKSLVDQLKELED